MYNLLLIFINLNEFRQRVVKVNIIRFSLAITCLFTFNLLYLQN